MRTIDLRSDTVTRPTPAMREAMLRADVGDDVYGEDPSVNALEELGARMLGQEAALFVASGTMANQLALGTLARAGDEVLCAEGAHCVAFEGGALSALWGIQPRALRGERGVLDPAAVEAAINAENDHLPRTRVVAVENTFNRGGGAVWPLERLRAVADVARRRGIALHLDGARLANAAAATGTPLRDLGALATTVTLCLSKGLGAPVGSLVASTRERVREMRRLRKRLGGGWRQAGLLAAAGIHALEHHLERLSQDHDNARVLADALTRVPGCSLVFPVETNMVFAAFESRNAGRVVASARELGVLCNAEGSRPDVVRLVTHLDVSRADVEEAARRLAMAAAA